MRFVLLLAASLLLAPAVRAADMAPKDEALAKSVAGPQRHAPNMARDRYRHPLQELEFFGIQPTMNVVEIWPEGGYWTEILASYLHDHGVYAVADPFPEQGESTKPMLDSNPAVYGNVKTTAFGRGKADMAPPESLDMIVTFRNIHNWMGEGFADQAFAAFYKALKPGGTLGVEEHRGRNDQPQDPRAGDGYVRQDYAVALAEKAGFKLVGSSEINANPKDTKDYPEGVWTLPPSYQLGDKDRAKYAAIGESDNFVLKFQKPGK